MTHVSGIDDFEDVGVSLFSAFNMLVLGVFQIDTVSCWRQVGRILIFPDHACGAVHQVRAEPGCVPITLPVFHGVHSDYSPESSHW